MAHFCILDENNIVANVVVISNDEILDENGNESEALGVQRCVELYGEGTYLQTSYNKTFRKNFGEVGFSYNSLLDAFIPPKPPGYDSFILHEASCTWIPPVDYPTDGYLYYWDEYTKRWIRTNAHWENFDE